MENYPKYSYNEARASLTEAAHKCPEENYGHATFKKVLNLKCDHCYFETKINQQLGRHIKIKHSDERLFACLIYAWSRQKQTQT